MGNFQCSNRINGCGVWSQGIPAKQALQQITSIIKAYPSSSLWAKGPALEERFLAGYADTPVIIQECSLPHINDLKEIGCPPFDAMRKDIREWAWKSVSNDHRCSFHSGSIVPHCCFVECIAMARWLASIWNCSM